MCKKFRDVKGKVAIITGAARGIGAECARVLASQGVNIVLADILPDVRNTWEDIHTEYPDIQGLAMIIDVTDEMQMKNLVETATATFGHLDIMYNNAGIHGGEIHISDVTPAHIDKVFNVNFKGCTYGCKYAAIQMKSQGYGIIVNTGSWYGKVGHAASAIYGASKAAVHTMSQALAMELAPYGITVNCICPALADTEMHWAFLRKEAKKNGTTLEQEKEAELSDIPLRRLGTGADSAGAILWLASESGSYVTGQLININGGLDFS